LTSTIFISRFMEVTVITGIDHVQLAMPRGREEDARAFYAGLLGLTEQPKPPVLAARGGCWFVEDLDALEADLTAAGHACVRADGEIPGVRRFHTHDPFGNRVEFQQA
jgi:catechol 2,3-dioxygenase-like lactoylglutathione lyase family enzyme